MMQALTIISKICVRRCKRRFKLCIEWRGLLLTLEIKNFLEVKTMVIKETLQTNVVKEYDVAVCGDNDRWWKN